MKKLCIICFSVLSIFIIGCGCDNISCAPCQGPPAIFYGTDPLIRFDTTLNNFELGDIDTLLLFKNENLVLTKTPSDSFFNSSNSVNFSGEKMRNNRYVSNQSMTRFIKIDNLQYITLNKGKGCCNCDKYETKSININDTVYLMSQLPITIKK